MFCRQVKNILGGDLSVESRGTGVGMLEVSLTFQFSLHFPCLGLQLKFEISAADQELPTELPRVTTELLD